mgnify:CR=1 FL=1
MLAWPVKGGRNQYPIGLGGTSEDHEERLGAGQYAIDIPAPEATPVIAIHDGVIDFTADLGGACGKSVQYGWMTLGTQWTVRTCHHSDLIGFSNGDVVSRGQWLAYVGHTGEVLGFPGDHIHIVIERNGVRVRPEDLGWEVEMGPDVENALNVLRGWSGRSGSLPNISQIEDDLWKAKAALDRVELKFGELKQVLWDVSQVLDDEVL